MSQRFYDTPAHHGARPAPPQKARAPGKTPAPARGGALNEALLVATIGLLCAWTMAEAALLAMN